MAKSLNDILKGVKKSTIAPPDIDDKNFYQWNAKDGVAFIKKHKIEKHDDRVGNGDDVYQGKTKKTTKYIFQKDGVYEAATCNHTTEGTMCEVHGKVACPTEDDVNMQPKTKKDAKGRQYLADKKKCMEETITEKKNLKDLFKVASLAGALAASAHRIPGVAYDVATNVHNQDPGYAIGTVAANMHPASRAANALATALKADPVGKGEDELERQKKYGKQLRAVVKEEQIDEVAPPDQKIEKWIKANKQRFIDRYGKEKGLKVLYGRAWNMHGKSESGTSSPATNTDYAGPGAAGWSTGRLDVGTL
jgi:hypothetical protein